MVSYAGITRHAFDNAFGHEAQPPCSCTQLVHDFVGNFAGVGFWSIDTSLMQSTPGASPGDVAGSLGDGDFV